MAKNTILIVEDEQDISELIHFHLFKEKFEVLECSNGLDAFKIAKSKMPSLIILDIMIPGLDGIALCKKLKDTAETKEIKIIFLSAKGEEQDIIRGLEIGADDYVTKPFSPKILMARVKTVLKRDGQAQFGKVLFQGIMLDDTKRKTTIDDNEVTLTVSEFQILKLLMSSPGHVFARNQIVNSIKGHNHAVTDRSVDTQLVSLRKKLGGKGKLIETVWGVGYRFKEHEA